MLDPSRLPDRVLYFEEGLSSGQAAGCTHGYCCSTRTLQKPVLVGHSIAGEEVSSIGSRYPEKVTGLIYLNAGNPYAFYDRAPGDLQLDLLDTRKQIEHILPSDPSDDKQAIENLLVSLPLLERDFGANPNLDMHFC